MRTELKNVMYVLVNWDDAFIFFLRLRLACRRHRRSVSRCVYVCVCVVSSVFYYLLC